MLNNISRRTLYWHNRREHSRVDGVNLVESNCNGTERTAPEYILREVTIEVRSVTSINRTLQFFDERIDRVAFTIQTQSWSLRFLHHIILYHVDEQLLD